MVVAIPDPVAHGISVTGSASSPSIVFARRPNQMFARLGALAVFIVPLAFLCAQLIPLIGLLIRYQGANLTAAHLVIFPIIAFLIFAGWLAIAAMRTVRRQIADRNLPLVTITPTGIALNRVNPIMIPWDDVTGVSLEPGFRGATTLLRVAVRDSGVAEGGAAGRIIDLRSLACDPSQLLAVIQGYPCATT